MKNNVLLQAMALDLKRVALGYHSGSLKMGDRFFQEAMKRKAMLDTDLLPQVLMKLITRMDALESEVDYAKKAEDALTYSTIFLSLSK